MNTIIIETKTTENTTNFCIAQLKNINTTNIENEIMNLGTKIQDTETLTNQEKFLNNEPQTSLIYIHYRNNRNEITQLTLTPTMYKTREEIYETL